MWLDTGVFLGSSLALLTSTTGEALESHENKSIQYTCIAHMRIETLCIYYRESEHTMLFRGKLYSKGNFFKITFHHLLV